MSTPSELLDLIEGSEQNWRRVIADAQTRAKARFGDWDTTVHTQWAHDEATVDHKCVEAAIESHRRLVDRLAAAERNGRRKRALALRAQIEETAAVIDESLSSVVVATVRAGNLRLVYWNWRYVYTVRETPETELGQFSADLEAHWLSHPADAVRAYGPEIVNVDPETAETARARTALAAPGRARKAAPPRAR